MNKKELTESECCFLETEETECYIFLYKFPMYCLAKEAISSRNNSVC